MSSYELLSLPNDVKEVLTNSYHLGNIEEYRREMLSNKSFKVNEASSDLFAMFDEVPVVEVSPAQVEVSKVVWGTDNYETRGEGYSFGDFVDDLSVIVPRVEKSKAEQKRRVKEKAEVFTPSWVCNVQNNLIDDHILYEGAFNKVSADKRSWVPSEKLVKFKKDFSWIDYVVSRRLEMCSGEGPYLMSRYDTTTGKPIPVRDRNGAYSRIGILDRKLRIVDENVLQGEKRDKSGLITEADDSLKRSWVDYALLALASTFGFEWQGDNLLIARLNFLNTFVEYYIANFGEAPEHSTILEAAEIASWNLWQMDGLKMVQPMSCGDDCKACVSKKKAGHNGRVSVLRFLSADGFVVKSFENLLPAEHFAK